VVRGGREERTGEGGVTRGSSGGEKEDGEGWGV